MLGRCCVPDTLDVRFGRVFLALVVAGVFLPAAGARAATSLRSCARSYSGFTAQPLADADRFAILPLGNLSPTAHVLPTDHIYFMLRRPDDGANFGTVVPVTSPGKVTVTDVATSSSNGSTEYKLTFSPCKQIHAYYGHMGGRMSSKVTSALRRARGRCNSYSTGGTTYRNCDYHTLSVSFAAGEVMGETSGLAAALDLGAYDDRVKLTFARNARHAPQSLSTICPLDLWASGARGALESILGDGMTRRTTAPRCGTITHDVTRTAQGHWYPKSQPVSQLLEDGTIALVHDNIDPSVPVFSVGNGVAGLASGRYTFTIASEDTINRDFSSVRPAAVHCYDDVERMNGSGSTPFDGRILVSMPSATTLRILGQAGACSDAPTVMPSGASQFAR